MTVEEIKKYIAEWMKIPIPPHPQKDWFPIEKGGKYLTEALAKLDLIQRAQFYKALDFPFFNEELDYSINGRQNSYVEFAIWMRDNKNAETILRSIHNVITNDGIRLVNNDTN